MQINASLGSMMDFLAATALAAAAVLMPDAAPAEIVVDVQVVNGTGCPPGTASVARLPDDSGFQLTFTAMRAAAGGTAPAAAYRKSCQVGLAVHIPAGVTYALASTDYAGTTHLADGATAQVRSTYYYAGGPTPRTFTRSFAGPLDDAWQATDTVDPAAQAYQSCGADAILNINTELRVTAGTDAAEESWIDLTDAAALRFDWQDCTA